MALGWRESYIRYREFYLNILALYKQKAEVRAFLEIGLSLGTIILFLALALKPTALTIIELYGSIQEKKKTSADLDLKISNLQTASTYISSNQNQIADIDTAVGSNPIPDIISQEIEALAAKDSVNILGISVGETAIIGTTPGSSVQTNSLAALPNNANSMSISISVKGNYQQLISFLKDIENLRTIIKLDSVGISSAINEKQATTVEVIAGRVPSLSQK